MKITVDIDEKDVKEKVIEAVARELINKFKEEHWLMFDINVDNLFADIFKKEYPHIYDKIKDEMDKVLFSDDFIRSHIRSYIEKVLRGEIN